MGPTWVLSDPDGPHVGPTNFAIWVSNISTTATPHIKCCHCNIPMFYDLATMDLMSILLGILHPTYHEILIHTYLEVTIFHETLVLELTIIYWSLSNYTHISCFTIWLVFKINTAASSPSWNMHHHPTPSWICTWIIKIRLFHIGAHFLFQLTSNSLQIWYNKGLKYAVWIWVFRCWWGPYFL